MSLATARKALRQNSNPSHAKTFLRFFKTGPGEYAEGDKFLGVKVPPIRAIAKREGVLPLGQIRTLLKSAWHEERMLALFLLIQRYQKNPGEQARVYALYMAHTRYINNWDLVDCSAPQIVGAFLESRSKAPLRALAASSSLWERRIAIIATFHFIRHGRYQPTLSIARRLLRDDADLIHKAVGWMLREVGNRDLAVEEAFLRKTYRKMPRTMLRYAIEKFTPSKRRAYLSGQIH